MIKEFWPGARVKVYDDRIKAFGLATVVCWYGFVSEYMEREYGRAAAIYPSCVDVIFDHRSQEVSDGHFTDHLEISEFFYSFDC